MHFMCPQFSFTRINGTQLMGYPAEGLLHSAGRKEMLSDQSKTQQIWEKLPSKALHTFFSAAVLQESSDQGSKAAEGGQSRGLGSKGMPSYSWNQCQQEPWACSAFLI